MLSRIHVRGYKSLCDLEVELKPLTLLFGPNTAGKSNLLDAMKRYMNDLTRQGGHPDLIVVATDANCAVVLQRTSY